MNIHCSCVIQSYIFPHGAWICSTAECKIYKQPTSLWTWLKKRPDGNRGKKNMVTTEKNTVTMEKFYGNSGSEKKTKPRKSIRGNLYLLLKSIRGNPEKHTRQLVFATQKQTRQPGKAYAATCICYSKAYTRQPGKPYAATYICYSKAYAATRKSIRGNLYLLLKSIYAATRKTIRGNLYLLFKSIRGNPENHTRQLVFATKKHTWQPGKTYAATCICYSKA